MDIRNQYILAEDWMVFFLLGGLAILAWVRYGFPKRLPRLLSSVIGYRTMKQLMREESLFSHRASQGLVLLYLISGAFLLVILSNSFKFYPIGLKGISLFMVCFFALFVALFVKILISRLLVYLMEEDYGLEAYLFNVLLINTGIGILLLPAIILMVYLPVLYVGLLAELCVYIVLIAFIYRIIRGAIIALEARANYMYIILYLCGLEILPIALCVKWLITSH